MNDLSRATALTSTGFLLRMKKFSALIIMKRMNLWQRIFSISSACKSKSQHHSHGNGTRRSEVGLNDVPTCFTAMLTRTELMEPSIRTFSLSLRLMITGWRRSSLLLLKVERNNPPSLICLWLPALLRWSCHRSSASPYFHLRLVVSLYHLGGEVLQAEGGLQGRTNRIQIWA